MMRYCFPFKTWPLAIIKLMWSRCLSPLQKAWWVDKGKEEGSKLKPCYGYRTKAMHNREAKEGTLSSGRSLRRGREQSRQVEGAAWELLHAREACHMLTQYCVETESDNNVHWKGSLKVFEQKLCMLHNWKRSASGWTGL